MAENTQGNEKVILKKGQAHNVAFINCSLGCTNLIPGTDTDLITISLMGSYQM